MYQEEQVENPQFTLPCPKKVFIVVGGMGIGKSSFVKMHVKDEDKGNVKADSRIKSLTSYCELYEIQQKFPLYQNQKFKNEELFIMDTPGLDSQSDAHKIILLIHETIVKFNLQVIGIGYVMMLCGQKRLLDKNDNSPILEFVKLLNFRMSIKKELMFMILTRYDRWYDEEEKIEEQSAQIQKYLTQQSMVGMWEKRIYWVSLPKEKPKDKFEKKIFGQEQLWHTYTCQKIQLTKVLQETSKHTQPIKDYISDYQNFLQKVQKLIKQKEVKEKSQIGYEKVIIKCEVNFCQKKNESRILKWFGRGASFVSFGLGCFRAARVIYFIATLAVGFTPIGGIIVPILWLGGGAIGAAVVNYGAQKVIQFSKSFQKDSKFQDKEKSKDELELLHQLNEFSNKLAFSEIISSFQVKEDKLRIKKTSRLSKIILVTEEINNVQIIKHKTVEQGFYEYDLKIKENQQTKLNFKFEVFRIRGQDLRSILKKEITEYYNEK